MTAKPKRDVRLPKASLLGPQMSSIETRLGLFETDLGKVEKSLDGYVNRLKMVEALQDKHEKDIAWLKAGQESHTSELKDFADRLEHFAKPSLWPLWTVLIVELAGLAYLFAKVSGLSL
jgi:hypothetical protein